MTTVSPFGKSELRRMALARRQTLPMPEISRSIVDVLRHWEVLQQAPVVLTYHPFRDEVDLMALPEIFPDKTWGLPRLEGNAMRFHRYAPGDALEIHAYGMKEPLATAEPVEPADVHVILLPALMMDRAGYRLGYGRGYYDRFLAVLPARPVTVAPVPQILVTEALPRDSWDRPLDWIVTESGLQSANRGSSPRY